MFKNSLVIIAFLISSIISFNSVIAQTNYKYDNESKILNNMGLFDGISTTEFNPGLNISLNRETGVALVLKIIGYKDEVLKLSDYETNYILKENAKDYEEISLWAKKYIAYAIKIGTVKGRTDGKFYPKDKLTGRDLSTMFLREMGIEMNAERWQEACFILSQRGKFPLGEAERLNTKSLIRDDMVGIAYFVLLSYDSQDKLMVKKLVETNVITKESAAENGFELREIVSLDIEEEFIVNVGDDFELPETIEARFSDDSKDDVYVSWEYYSTEFQGDFNIFGVVNDFNKEIMVNLIVEDRELYVRNIEVLNLKQIEIEFNKGLDSDTALDYNNYALYNYEQLYINPPYQLKLNPAGNGVILTLDDKSEDKILVNNSKLKVIVKKGIKDFTNKTMHSDYEFEKLEVKDSEKPYIDNVMQTSTNSLRIFFSEPIKDESNGIFIENNNIIVDNRALNVIGTSNNISESYVDIVLNNELINGDHTISVNIDDDNDIVDFANNRVEKGLTYIFTTNYP
jgi:hypothetical protein